MKAENLLQRFEAENIVHNTEHKLVDTYYYVSISPLPMNFSSKEMDKLVEGMFSLYNKYPRDIQKKITDWFIYHLDSMLNIDRFVAKCSPNYVMPILKTLFYTSFLELKCLNIIRHRGNIYDLQHRVNNSDIIESAVKSLTDYDFLEIYRLFNENLKIIENKVISLHMKTVYLRTYNYMTEIYNRKMRGIDNNE